ncbi:sensor histidine kinase [Amycolatopsis sp. cg5]|uniref:sensor histidine kinase n=1 Tax=Amycolatopsis sp. cg5 TaxID=3238802 RepID=UPI0035236865
MRNVAGQGFAWLRGAADWRKWTVSGLLAAMLAVPVAVAVVAGVLLVRQSVADRAETQQAERLAALHQGIGDTLAAVQAERGVGSDDTRAASNSAAARLNSLIATAGELGDPARKAASQLVRLDEIRATPDPGQRGAAYSAVTASLADLDAAVQRGTGIPRLDDAQAAAAASATYARNLLIGLAVAALVAGAVITPLVRRLHVSVQALRTAVHDAAAEQTRIRAGYSEVFVNMFRRGETLMQRQLGLIEKLEQNENSPEQLTTLYQLDHLVTRMRRTTENVLVLSGTELVRRPAKPVPLAGVIQAAISEIEQYQRVELLDPPAAKIGDAAANDLIRMLAELLDNATSFSAPETKVTVQGQVLRDGSLSIAVVDTGIGMTDQEVVDINARLTRLGSAELAKCRQVGLHVVGRLAGRHGFGIELLGGDRSSGVTAVVSVPSDLVLDAERPGWADRRIAMRAAETRRAEPEPKPKPARRLAVVGTDPVRELVEHAHSDVPDELPLRVPNRHVGRAGADGKSPAERVASGWFNARNTAVKPREVSVAAELDGAPLPENWISAADEGWSVVETISQAKPFAYTEDGLPVRERGAHLMPGSAPHEPAAKAGPDPSRARSRLSSFQLGLRKAKDENRR